MKMRCEKNQYLLRYSLPHYCALYCAAFIQHLQWQYPVSTFGIEKVFVSMKRLPAIQKMLVSPADFSTRPVGRVLWEESLVLSKIHSSIRVDEWIFCPLGLKWRSLENRTAACLCVMYKTYRGMVAIRKVCQLTVRQLKFVIFLEL